MFIKNENLFLLILFLCSSLLFTGHSLPVLCVHLFNVYGLIDFFRLDIVRLWKLFKLIEDGYHSTNPYHNSIHATDVTQAMHCFLQEKKIIQYLEPIEIMASIIGSVSHDLDHPGVNQPFLIATSNHLAQLYDNTSVLENHHWRSAISCLLESGIADQINSDIRPLLHSQICSLILATDITRQGEFILKLHEHTVNNSLNMKELKHRHFVLQMALKCADISNPCRPWDICRIWSNKVCEEFFQQGDIERKLDLPVTTLCDRYSNTIPKIQMDFFKYVVTPLYMEWHLFLNTILSNNIMQLLDINRLKWEELADQLNTKLMIVDDENISIKSAKSIRLKRNYSLQNSNLFKNTKVELLGSGGNCGNTDLIMTNSFKMKLNRKRGSLPIIKNSSIITSPTNHDTNILLSEFRDGDSLLYFIDDDIDNVLCCSLHEAEPMFSTKDTSPLRNDMNMNATVNNKYLCRQQTFPPIQQQQKYISKNFSHNPQNPLNSVSSFLKKHRNNISPSLMSLNEEKHSYYHQKLMTTTNNTNCNNNINNSSNSKNKTTGIFSLGAFKPKKMKVKSQKENFLISNDRRSSAPIITSKTVQNNIFLRRKSIPFDDCNKSKEFLNDSIHLHN